MSAHGCINSICEKCHTKGWCGVCNPYCPYCGTKCPDYYYIDSKFVIDLALENLIGQLKDISNEERLKIFSNFCTYCGCIQEKRRCQCWNDE